MIYKKYPEKAKVTLKNWCFWIVVLEKILESPLDYKEIKPVNLKGNQPWLFIRRTDVQAPILWSPDAKSQFPGKDPDAGKDWKQKGMTEDEMVGWYYRLDGHEYEQAQGVGDGQGGLACCSSWGLRESDMTEWLNWAELIQQNDCYTYIHILFHILFHYGLSQDIEYSSLWYTVGSCCLSSLYII